ncbi:hypothetical protein ACIF6K_31545 [Streptomyces sp. NPDC085942]|uniref:hypothetical protein n=1 Tax=Streptomyces sp. NPDC085942 TaxID=3365743 RepID=UPI0037D973C2
MAESVVGAADEGVVDIALLVRARARLSALVVQLEVAPFSAQTVAAMRAYLDGEAESARVHFERWVALPKRAREELAVQLRGVER